MQFANNLMLFKVTGFFVEEFYILAENEQEAEEKAKRLLTFQVEECKVV